MTDSTSFPLDAYAERVGYTGALTSTTETVTALHAAHAHAIPFENLDIHLGRPIRIDRQSLIDKIIGQRRGGYCYEMNGIFALALQELGAQVQMLAARNSSRPWEQRQRTHLALLAEVAGQRLLCDLGFGIFSPIVPIPFEPGSVFEQFGYAYRIDITAFGHALSMRLGEEWQELYSFSLEPCPPVDFEIMNYFNSTHPGSPFVQTKIVARPQGHSRRALRGSTLITREGGAMQSREISDPAQYDQALREIFGLHLPAPMTGETRA